MTKEERFNTLLAQLKADIQKLKESFRREHEIRKSFLRGDWIKDKGW